MSLILRCQKCRSLNLAIGSGDESHHASLNCSDCGRFVRWLSVQQAKTFGRHLPSTRQQNLFEHREGNQ